MQSAAYGKHLILAVDLGCRKVALVSDRCKCSEKVRRGFSVSPPVDPFVSFEILS